MIILLDATRPVPPAAALGQLVERLKRLGPVFAWGGAVPGLDTLSALGDEPVAVVGTDQPFLDEAVARAGLDKAPAGCDVFTQWEHCRLPVGVGLRVVSGAAVRRTGCTGLAEALEHMRRHPAEFTVRYDDTAYVSYEDSLLDARWHGNSPSPSGRGVGVGDEGVDYSLAGFLALARGLDLRFQPGEADGPTDERGLPAQYGFEARATAGFPTYLMFDLTNKCNAACIHCPQSVGFPGSENATYIDPEDFRAAIDQCVGRPMQFIRITADGEPLLHPRFWDMVEYARDRGVGPVGLTTNGSALTEARARRLIEAKLFMVDVSLDAASAQTYAKVRAGLDLERTQGNILKLLSLRREMGSPLKVMVSFVKQKDNLHEVDAFRAFWQDRVDEVLIREMISNVGINDVSGSVDGGAVKRWPCPHVFRRTVLDYNGNVKFCPIDWVGGSVLGKFGGGSLEKAWLDEPYRTLRLAHLNDSFPAQSICAACRDWQGSPWTLGYEKVVSRLKDQQ